MLAALENGVKGGKWYSLIDKVWDKNTLWSAWWRVSENHGAAGVDRISIERFREKAEQYLGELEQGLKSGGYTPEAVRRVYIPKGPGQTRALGIPVGL